MIPRQKADYSSQKLRTDLNSVIQLYEKVSSVIITGSRAHFKTCPKLLIPSVFAFFAISPLHHVHLCSSFAHEKGC